MFKSLKTAALKMTQPHKAIKPDAAYSLDLAQMLAVDDQLTAFEVRLAHSQALHLTFVGKLIRANHAEQILIVEQNSI